MDLAGVNRIWKNYNESTDMLEKMKAAFSRLSVLAGAYLPPGFKDALLDMAQEIDRLRAEVNELKKGKS